MLRQADKVNARGERRRQVKTLAGEKKKKAKPLWLLSIKCIVEPFRVKYLCPSVPGPDPPTPPSTGRAEVTVSGIM